MENNDQIRKVTAFSTLSGKGGLFFFVQLVAIFAITFTILYVIGLVPKELRGTPTAITDTNTVGSVSIDADDNDEYVVNSAPNAQTRPDSISISKLGLSAAIGHPNSQNINVLDQFLSQGVVHYPGSGMLEEGNIFLFGHSADRFQFVSNDALKVFNGLSELENGDTITLTGDGKEYVYAVDNVSLVNADTAFVNFNKTGQTLTISTCNTFGELQERWVVEATLKTIRG